MPPRTCVPRLSLCAWLIVLLVLAMQPGQAQERSDPEPETYAALVTYGPGEIYWQRFGHNAIHLRNPARGIDHLFNFGFFSFQQEGFIRRFIQGRLYYLALARTPAEEFEEYRAAGRSIRVQELSLTPAQYRRLEAYLVDQVQPDKREYLYDYFTNNCSTRLRDALDLALGGSLARDWQAQPAALSLRQQVNRTTRDDAWLHLGLAAGLGLPIDRPANLWQETFIPSVLASAVAQADNPVSGTPLVQVDRLPEPGTVIDPDNAQQAWLPYLGWGLLLAVLLWLPGRFSNGPRIKLLPVWGWLLPLGLAGGLLGWLWLFTDHAAVRPNWNIQLFNPLFLLAGLACLLAPLARWWRLLAWLAPLGWLSLLLLRLWPGYPQDNAAVVALAAAPSLLLVASLWRLQRA